MSTVPEAHILSFWIGDSSWGCPSSRRVVWSTVASLELKKGVSSSASDVDAITVFMMEDIMCMALLKDDWG